MSTVDIRIPEYVVGLIARLESGGHEAVVVGGCVRDALMHRAAHDWDMATDATVRDMQACFEGYKTVNTGIRHGTITVIADGHPVEVTTYRTGTEETTPVTLQMDLAHRDLTVNAMAYHPDRGLTDLFGGAEDVAKRRIRFVQSAADRIEEDPLRLLRALRFASALDFEIDEEGCREIRKKAGYLSVVAPERIQSEFRKLIAGPAAGKVIRDYSNVWKVFLPEAAISLESARVADAIGYSVPDEAVRLALAFMPTDKALPYTEHSVGHYLKALRMDNALQETVKKILAFPYERLEAEPVTLNHLIVEKSLPIVRKAIDYHYAVHCMSFSKEKGALDKVAQTHEQLRSVVEELVCSGACMRPADLAVSGTELIAAGIVQNGPEVGQCLNRLLNAVIDRKINNAKEDLLEFAAQCRT